MTNNEEKLKIVIEALDNSSKTLDGVVGKLGKIQSTAKTTGTSLTKAFNSAKLIAVFTMLTRTVLKSIKASSDYVENLNLFEVAMGKNIKMAHQFTSAISENFGMDKSEVIRYMGAFSNLAESMGNTAKNAYAVSEALTTIGYDLASLWNISTASAMEKLQAGLVGQTKPLRSIGIDTTYATLQMYAFELGIKEQVKVLSQSDKQLLRTIAIMRQASSSWGDMAKTIETPANQMRVFKSQIDKVSRAFGNLFMGLFGKVLPYINAFLMIIYELLSALGRILGFTLPTYNADNSFGGIQDDVDGVNDSVKDLNKSLGLMDFDELHNVNTKDASGGYTAGGYGDILGNEINDIMEEYEKQLESVKMKALEIRDTIMEWLGFTKLTNAETGELEFKFKGITSGTVIAGLTTIGAVFLSIAKLFKVGKGISMLFTGGKGVATTATALEATGVAGTAVGTSFASIATLVGGILLVVGAIVAMGIAMKQAYDKSKPFRDGVHKAFTDIKQALEDLWKKVIVPLAEFISKVFAPIWEHLKWLFEQIWKNVMLPLAEFIGTIFSKIWSALGEILVKVVIPKIEKMIEVLTWLWINVLEPIGKFLKSVFQPIFEEVFKAIGTILDGLTTVLGGVIDFIVDIFTGDWKGAWENVKIIFSGIWSTFTSLVRTPLNAILGMVESVVNGIINAFNRLILPDWLKSLLGINGKTQIIPNIKIPKISDPKSAGSGGFAKGGVIGLASGGLITKPMMYRGVMTGENYRKEAIIPLQRTDIVSQFASNISDNIVGALGAINDQPIVNQFYVDGIKVTESVNKRTKEFNNMYGKNIA